MPVEIIEKNYTQGLKLHSWVQHLFNVRANWSQKDNSLITAPYNQFQLTTLDPSKQMKIISVALWAQQIDLIKMNLLDTLHPESLTCERLLRSTGTITSSSSIYTLRDTWHSLK